MKIKGFDKDLKCRGMQFEIGEIYDTGAKDDEIHLCSNTVFHYCDSISKVHDQYRCDRDNRFCEIEVLGAEVTDGEQYGSNRIKVIREIVGDELDVLLGKINGNTGLFNTGYWNTGSWNTGSWNTGNRNTGDWNTGDWNTGNCNTGNWNTGNWNTGDRNTGDWNTGDWNTGNCNTGNWNTGNWNTGDWNTCSGSNGVFCTEEDRNIRIFNAPSGMSLSQFRNSEYYDALMSSPFLLTEWVEYTQAEMDTEEKKSSGGYLKQRTYKEACSLWWEKMSQENREIVQRIPNFNADIFLEITGIDVRKEDNHETREIK